MDYIAYRLLCTNQDNHENLNIFGLWSLFVYAFRMLSFEELFVVFNEIQQYVKLSNYYLPNFYHEKS